MKLLITNCSQIATPQSSRLVKGEQMKNIALYKNSTVCIEDGIIKDIIPDHKANKLIDENCIMIDAGGKTAIPAFVDCHSHYLFAGQRREEFFMRQEGKTYIDILNAGGGIGNTVNKTRLASKEDLIKKGLTHLDNALSQGITLTEGKSGYGLDRECEIKQLEAMKELDRIHPVKTVRTFLGAHAVAKEFEDRSNEYIDYIIHQILPIIKKQNHADFCDVFCEKGVFTSEQAYKLLSAALSMGLGAKIHADEMISTKGAELACRLGAISADHLLAVSDEGINCLAKSETVAVLLPCTAFCLGSNYAPARRIIDSGGGVALGTDYNPGSCNCFSISLTAALAYFEMNMTPAEILTALTVNAAAALGKATEYGSIEIGKKADILLLDTDDYRDIIYQTNRNLVEAVIADGDIVYKDGEKKW